MSNAIAVGWRTVTVTAVRNFTINKPTGAKNFLKFIVDVHDGKVVNHQASMLVEPTLIPGKALYQWLRVCNIPLSAIDDKLRPELFVGMKVYAKIVMNGDFYNITEIKQLDSKK